MARGARGGGSHRTWPGVPGVEGPPEDYEVGVIPDIAGGGAKVDDGGSTG